MRWTLVRGRSGRAASITCFLLLKQQPAHRPHAIELLLLLVDQLIQLLDGIFQTYDFQLYLNEALFHCGFTRHLLKRWEKH